MKFALLLFFPGENRKRIYERSGENERRRFSVKKNPESTKQSLTFRDYLSDIAPIAACFLIGAILIGVGIFVNRRYRMAEKIKYTFTEPVVSVSKQTDDDGRVTGYKFRMNYTVDGKQYTYSIQEKTKAYSVGDPVTFTVYFYENGKQAVNHSYVFIVIGGSFLFWFARLTFGLIRGGKKKRRPHPVQYVLDPREESAEGKPTQITLDEEDAAGTRQINSPREDP